MDAGGHCRHGIVSVVKAETREKAIETAKAHHMQHDRGFAAWEAYLSYVEFEEEHMS